MDQLPPALESRVARAVRWAHEHPKRVGAGVLVVLAGFAATAFGVVSPLPDPSLLPQRVVTETYQPEGLDAQLDALAVQPLALSRSDTTRSDETVESLFKRTGIVDADAAAFLRSDAIARRLFTGRPGKLVAVTTDQHGRLQQMVVRYPAERDDQFSTHFSRLTVSRGAHGFEGKIEQAPLQTAPRLASGLIRTSLFAATDDANIPDPVATQMAEMFSTDIDFHRELRKGDTFSVVYEALTADGEPVPWNQGAGRVLAAEFVNGGHPYTAVWFQDPATGKGAYFDMDGRSKHRAFLASPLEFSRVTSGFSMRFHPILQQWKKHEGVDYGAPIGTAVRVVGDGVVSFAGVQNGFGNVIHVQHAGGRETVYAHLSHIDVHNGQRVDQGQRIGAVGMTGWATGPHLHFEFHVGGVVKDPLAIAKASETITLDAASKPRFALVAQKVKGELAVAGSFVGNTGAVRD